MKIVWIIEDDDDLAQVISGVAQRRGFVPVIFKNLLELKQTWGVCRAGDALIPDMIISDVNLPDGTTCETLVEIHRELPSVRIVVQTGCAEEELLTLMRANGIVVLEKPTLLSQLFKNLSE